MTRLKFLMYWSIVVGSMDALAGFLLIVSPGGVLQLLKIDVPSPDAMIYLSWIGIFVMAVGLSYGLALGKRGWGEAVWMFTSLVRILVAVFLTVRILDESMSKMWALVAVADAMVALVQMVVLRANWWREVHR